MRRLAPIALLACLPVLASTALAIDNGQFDHVPPDIRAWFKSVIAPNGVPCATSPMVTAPPMTFVRKYWVPIEGEWMQVPARAIIRDHGNPIGEAVVWYVRHRGSHHHQFLFPADACEFSPPGVVRRR